MIYEIRLKEVEPMRIAYVKYHGKVQAANKFFPKVFRAIRGKSSGAPFLNYLNLDPKTKIGDMELCVPTLENFSSDSVLIKNLPSTKVLSTIHKGPYENIMAGYEELKEYSLEKNIELQPVFREIFIKGPGLIIKGNPNNYITEIQLLIRED